MQNFASTSLLTAVGVGAKRAVAASAAINWMLKDGLGRITRMTVATKFGQSFDSDLKRFRFQTSLFFTACVACEFLTPLFPQHFLLLATIAGMGRAVGITTFVSTQPAFQQSLAAGGNLADLTAKTQAQHMVMDTLALAISATATFLCRNNDRARLLLPLAAFPLCAVGDLVSIYKELKAVQLRTMNRERAEMIAERWVAHDSIPTAAEISSLESLFGSPNIAGGFLPMRIVPLEQLARSPQHLASLMREHAEDHYLLDCIRDGEGKQRQGAGWRALGGDGGDGLSVDVSLSDEAHSADILMAVLETAHLRRALQWVAAAATPGSSSSRTDGQLCKQDSNARTATGGSSGRAAVSRDRRRLLQDALSAISEQQLRAAVKESHKLARRDVQRFVRDVQAAGWQVKPILLSTNEKSTFSRTSRDR